MRKNPDKRIIVVVGGGPAGMMAAIAAGQLCRNVTLIEKNSSLGRKLLLSGKGRCNLTNACSLEDFLIRFSGNGGFLRDAFKQFFNQDLISFFEERGLKLKIERQQRVFPASDSSNIILKILAKELRKNKVKILFNSAAKKVTLHNGRVKAVAVDNKKDIPCDRLILATGGISYGFTGSTGDGFAIARQLGHAITALRPGLIPLETKQPYPRRLEGLTLRNIRLRFTYGRRQMASDIGELMFTKTGISGPLVLSLSGRVVDGLDKKNQVYLDIDLKPALSKEQLEARLLREFKASPARTIKNILKNLLPQRLISLFLEIAEVEPGKNASHVSRAERRRLIELFKALRLEIKGPRPIKEAMVTQGGISLKEIDPRTMASRIIEGLYFAGEIIDVDADTGGFNLQSAFSTGYLAGKNAAIN